MLAGVLFGVLTRPDVPEDTMIAEQLEYRKAAVSLDVSKLKDMMAVMKKLEEYEQIEKHYENGYKMAANRIKSDLFAQTAASVYTANGVAVNICPRLLPIPTVSYAARYHGTSAGVMITASHNPSKYNGYKVYGADGCQITTEAAAEILAEIEKLDIFADVKKMDFDETVKTGKVAYIKEEVLDSFIEQVKKQSVLYSEDVDKNVAIAYSPLNGTGLEPVTRVLDELGYKNITIVEEQKNPDGNFPTCPYPNTEIKEALQLGFEYCRKIGADLMLATDPDCDRVVLQ